MGGNQIPLIHMLEDCNSGLHQLLGRACQPTQISGAFFSISTPLPPSSPLHFHLLPPVYLFYVLEQTLYFCYLYICAFFF